MTPTRSSTDFETATFAKVVRRLVPLLFLGYFVAFLDRVNVGFAKLQMAGDLQFGDAVYGFGAGVFFLGYFLFEVPSNLILKKVGARVWIARIMITWGLISSSFMFIDTLAWGPIAAWFNCTDAEFSFYLLRFLLGAAEAGFFPGVILYLTFWFPALRRAQVTALFMSAIAVSNVFGGPLSGAIMQFMDGVNALRGWQWLFLLEGIPSVLVGFVFLAKLPNGPASASWLTIEERDLVIKRVAEDEDARSQIGRRGSLSHAFSDPRLWAFTLVYFCGVVCFYAVSLWLPTIVQELGFAPGDYFGVGLVSAIPWTIGVTAQILWARHSDRTGERRWHSATGLLISIIGLVMLAFVNHAAIPSLIALTLIIAGNGCWGVTFWSQPTAFLAGSGAAAGIAWINSVGNLGGYFGPSMIGYIRAATGGESAAAFLALAAAALVGALVTLATPTHARKAPPPAPKA